MDVSRYGGNPLVTAATTKHNEPQYAARGPFEGNTEITISGNAFFPSTGLLCRLHDGVTNATMILTAHFDSMQQIRCISQRKMSLYLEVRKLPPSNHVCSRLFR